MRTFEARKRELPPPVIFDEQELTVSDEYLAEIKAHGNIDADDDDSLLKFYATAALQGLHGFQGELGAYLVKTGIQQDFPFPKLDFPLTGPYFETENFPVIDYRDRNGNRVVINNEEWFDVKKSGGFQISVTNKIYSLLCSLNSDGRRDNFVTIKYYAGIAETVASLPSDLRYAVALVVRRMYDYRDDTIRLDRTDISGGVATILNRYRAKWLG